MTEHEIAPHVTLLTALSTAGEELLRASGFISLKRLCGEKNFSGRRHDEFGLTKVRSTQAHSRL
jgi:hypothetical protein